jgi:aminoglycoside phosphotransferase (APT) family kinase protein
MTASEFEARARRLVADLGLAPAEAVLSARPLAGGVASDIGVVDLGDRRICVKFALEKLKVAADWRAPVHRNRAEYAWLAFAGRAAPGSVPALSGWSATENGFAMEYLAGPDILLWKAELLAGRIPPGAAAAVGTVLSRIHAASAGPDFDAAPFRNAEDFRALRLEPYLGFTATRHPDLAGRLYGLAAALDEARTVLVHGDVSPKNILLREGNPILLDAECATMGDAAFDVAFCLNHLALKAVHLPAIRAALFTESRAFWAAYRAEVSFEDPDALEARVAALLPALMLARIDGKSPAEYLSEAGRDRVRRLALPLVAAPPARLSVLISTLQSELDTHG